MTRRALLLALLGVPLAGPSAAQAPRRRRCWTEQRRVVERDRRGRLRRRTVPVRVCEERLRD